MAQVVTAVPFGSVLGVRVAATTTIDAALEICRLSSEGVPGYVCAAPVHSIMEAKDHPAFRSVLNGALMVVPDGFPVAVALRLQGFHGQPRVPGPDLMLELCKRASQSGIRVGFFGSSEQCLALLADKLPEQFPSLNIAYKVSPPDNLVVDRPDEEAVQAISDAQVDLLFVGLGCPKQEIWMSTHSSRLNLVMVGVGAAFDFHAGLRKRAPALLQNIGMEWAYRLAREPRRLWRRYLKHNPRFVWYVLLSLLQPKSKREARS